MSRLERDFKLQGFKSKRILLIDDEEDFGWIMKNIFKEAGHRLIYATSMEEGIEKFKNSKNLDMAIVDLMLGNDSGLSFVRKAKAINDRVELIMISAFGDSDVKNEARQLGVRHFLDKPVSSETLLDIISEDSL